MDFDSKFYSMSISSGWNLTLGTHNTECCKWLLLGRTLASRGESFCCANVIDLAHGQKNEFGPLRQRRLDLGLQRVRVERLDDVIVSTRFLRCDDMLSSRFRRHSTTDTVQRSFEVFVLADR